jgi:hypothetical protein
MEALVDPHLLDNAGLGYAGSNLLQAVIEPL